AGADGALAGDEGGAAGGAALLPVPVGEAGPFPGDAVDVGRLISHDAAVVAAGVDPADVIPPDDEDIGLLRPALGPRGGTEQEGEEQDQDRRSDTDHERAPFQSCSAAWSGPGWLPTRSAHRYSPACMALSVSSLSSFSSAAARPLLPSSTTTF